MKTIPGKSRGFYIMTSGPYDGKQLYLQSSGTLPFRVGEYYGYYDQFNTWQSLK